MILLFTNLFPFLKDFKTVPPSNDFFFLTSSFTFIYWGDCKDVADFPGGKFKMDLNSLLLNIQLPYLNLELFLRQPGNYCLSV